MNKKETAGREVTVRELFWDIVMDWRRIICCLIIAALALTGIKYLKDTSDWENVSSDVATEQEEAQRLYEEELSEEEKEQIEDVRMMQAMVEENRSYNRKSKLMNINPFEEQMAILEYYIDTDYTFNYTQENKPDETEKIVAAYENYINSGELAQKIAENTSIDLEEKFILELITTENQEEADILQVRIIWDEPEMLKEMVNVVKEEILAQTNQIDSVIGAHKITLVSEYSQVCVDTKLAASQKSQQDTLNNLKNQLSTLKGSMTQTQMKILEMENETASDSENKKLEERPQISKKYMILGGFLGVCIACGWCILRILCSARLQNTKELSELYDLRILGKIEVEGKKKRFLSVIDRWLLKIQHRGKKQLTLEQQIDMVCSGIEIACESENTRKFYLTGSRIEMADSEILRKIKEKLADSEIELQLGENVLYNAKALKEMAENGYVLFLEENGESLYEEISDEIRIALEQQIHILGGITWQRASYL